jgi:hypothetical protein
MMHTYEAASEQQKFMSSLLLAWSRAALILTAAVAYLLGFAPLYSAWGAGVAALSALPVVAAVLGIVRGHCGTLKVVSQRGHGTTVTALFARATGEPSLHSGAGPALATWSDSSPALVARVRSYL